MSKRSILGSILLVVLLAIFLTGTPLIAGERYSVYMVGQAAPLDHPLAYVELEHGENFIITNWIGQILGYIQSGKYIFTDRLDAWGTIKKVEYPIFKIIFGVDLTFYYFMPYDKAIEAEYYFVV